MNLVRPETQRSRWRRLCSILIHACWRATERPILQALPTQRVKGVLRFMYRTLLQLPYQKRGAQPFSEPSLDRLHVTTTFRIPDINHYDLETRLWVNRILQGGSIDPLSERHDPEAVHDILRLRGVLSALGECYGITRSALVRSGIKELLLRVPHYIETVPAAGWDTSTAALRLISILRGLQILRRFGLDLPVSDEWLASFVSAHRQVLDLGAAIEPLGNHQAVNAAGRASYELLLRRSGALPVCLAEELRATFAGQFLQDGGHIERSPHYHLQVLSLLDDLRVVDGERGGRLACETELTVKAACRALRAMLTSSSQPIRFADNGRAFSGKKATTEIGHLLGASPYVRPRIVSLPYFGLATMRWGFPSERNFELVVDLGPLGLEGNPGHGHADALSFTLAVAGRDIIADPGTYLYANHPEAMWYKLPQAHNTVDWSRHPSHELSRFFYWRRAPAPPTTNISGPDVRAFHANLAWKVGRCRHDHYRRWEPIEDGLRILDRVRSSSRESAIARFLFHPAATVNVIDSRSVEIMTDGMPIRIDARGPNLGPTEVAEAWYAPRYGCRVNTTAVQWSFSTDAQWHSIQTEIRLCR